MKEFLVPLLKEKHFHDLKLSSQQHLFLAEDWRSSTFSYGFSPASIDGMNIDFEKNLSSKKLLPTKTSRIKSQPPWHRGVFLLFWGGNEGWWDVVNVFFLSSIFFIQLVCMFLVSARIFFPTDSRMELTRIIKQLFLIEVQFFTKTWANWDVLFECHPWLHPRIC